MKNKILHYFACFGAILFTGIVFICISWIPVINETLMDKFFPQFKD